MRIPFSGRLGVCLALLLCLATAKADSSAGGPGLSLTDVIARTLERNPALLAFGYQLEIQEGRLRQSRLGPNPEFGVAVENAAGSGAFEGMNRAETTLSLALTLERGKRARRIDAARAGASLLESEADFRRLDAAAETARRFLDSLANQERLLLSDAAVRLAEQTVAGIAALVDAGRSPEADLARAEAELARARLDREDLEHELLVSIRRLAAQWGETRPAFTRVAGDVHALPVADSFADLLASIDGNPDLARYLTEKRLREAELRLAEAEAKPSWRISAGVRRLEQSDDQVLVAGVTIPLAMRNRNQGRIAEARARLAMTDADRVATRVRIETRLFALHQELLHSLHRAATLRDEILPRMEQALTDTERAYAAGRYGYFELRVAQAELLDARTVLVDASIDAHRNTIEIERLTGTTFSSSAGQL